MWTQTNEIHYTFRVKTFKYFGDNNLIGVCIIENIFLTVGMNTVAYKKHKTRLF